MMNAMSRVEYSKRGNRNSMCRVIYDQPKKRGIMQPGDLPNPIPPNQSPAPQQNLYTPVDAYNQQKRI